MRCKLLIGVAVQTSSLLAAFSDGVCTDQAPLSCWDLRYRSCWHGGYEAHGALLFVRPVVEEKQIAICDLRRVDGGNDWGRAFLPSGEQKELRPGFEVGFQLGVGALLNGRKVDAQVIYTGLFTRDRCHVVPRDIQGIWPSLGHPRYLRNRLNNATVTGSAPPGALDAFANSKLAVDYNTLDAELCIRICSRWSWYVCPMLCFRWLLMSLSQHTHYEGTAVYSATPDTNAQRHRHRSTAKSWGIGPRVGVSLRRPIRCGVGVIGQLTGGLLGGESNLLSKQHHQITTLTGLGINVDQRLEVRCSDRHLFPVLDGRFGMNFFRRFGDTFYLDIQLGWMGTSYFDAVAAHRFNNKAGADRRVLCIFQISGIFGSLLLGI